MGAKTSYQGKESEKIVKILGRFLPISHKASYEVAASIRGKDVNSAISYLENVAAGKQALPFKRYLRDVPHRRGKIAAGRFPKKTSLHVVSLLKTLKKNAEDKNLNAEKLKIVHSAAQKGPNVMHRGRVRGRRKITHFEILAEETEEKSVKKKEKKKK